ncbi:MAG: AAA-like domain-containing protein [Armatimonadetes bacterium]|nr:AAA-like domain-containing protein [Armatimonadota bacterium]
MKSSTGRDGLPQAPTWSVKLLGQFEVRSASNEIAKFSTRKSGLLLAVLALYQPREFSNEELQELFWPESDGDRQSQSLRRAIADLRQVLEQGLPHGSIVATNRSTVALCSERVVTDLERFLELTNRAEADVEDLAEAVSIYAGPLLAPFTDEWIVPKRMEIEERFAQAVDQLCNLRVQSGALKEAIRIGRTAAVAAPMREDIHVTLISAYRRANMEAEAIRQFEILEQMLSEYWGEPPSSRAREALEGKLPSSAENTVSKAPTRSEARPLGTMEAWFEPSAGALPVDSPYYVCRALDRDGEALIERREGVVLIQGPRQVGKSSFLARLLAFARTRRTAVVLTDAQSLGEAQMGDGDTFYKLLGEGLATELGHDLDLHQEWRQWLGRNANLNAVLGKLLANTDQHVCWAIDEADLLFDRPYTNDFFGLLRSWYNRRALDPHGPWRRLTLVLTYAREATLFISDVNQSPFNVGVRLHVKDFSLNELMQLQSRYASLTGRDLSPGVFELTHGHPYLSQIAFAYLAQGGAMEELASTAADHNGPFGSHLKHMLMAIAQQEETLDEVKRLLRGDSLLNPTTRYRLESTGLITLRKDGGQEFRVPAYESYLRTALG